MAKSLSTSKARGEDELVDFLLNVYDNCENPVSELALSIGSTAEAQVWLERWQSLAKDEPARFVKCNGAEMGDRTIRSWIRECSNT